MPEQGHKADPQDTTIAFIGCGVMGSSMAGHLVDAGYDVTVYTRTKEKAKGVLDKGASWADSAAAAVFDADVVITMVGYPADVEDLYMGDEGILESAKDGAYLIDMTTSSPQLAADIFVIAETKDLHALDAPVSGGDIGARNATLTIMVGGKQEDFDFVLPILETMGKTVMLQGKAGSGQHTKMANQVAIAGTMMGAIESIAYAQNAGLDPAAVIKSISAGSGTSWSIENYGPRILAEDFKPGFYVKHFIKDMEIALDSADEMNLVLPGLETARELYMMLGEVGGYDLGTQALWLLYANEDMCAKHGLDMDKLKLEPHEEHTFEFDDLEDDDEDGSSSSFLDSPYLNEN